MMLIRKATTITLLVLFLAGLIFGLIHPKRAKAELDPLARTPAGLQQTSPPAIPDGQKDNPLDKIEPVLLQDIGIAGELSFFVWMTEKADLSPAYQLETKEEKGRFVYEALRQTADRTQKSLRAELDKQDLSYRPFYIANKIFVQGGSQQTLLDIASRTDVVWLSANHAYVLEEPVAESDPPIHIASVGSNLSFVNADDVWALGYDGDGTVLAGIDTGLDWDHAAIKNHYRGWNGAVIDHNYSWWDATGSYPTAPGDGHGHGTHTTGTMVGDDGAGNRIGMAPGAKTIHCKSLNDSGSGNDRTASECFEWILAPWDLSGNNPRPDLAPDAVNNSWGYGGGGRTYFIDEIAALRAAGIVVEVSAGNAGPNCQTLSSPGDYDQSLTTGSVNHSGGSLPGALTGFSSRGASSLYPGETIPDVMAPGQNIRSSLPGNTYASWDGTSMAGPHVTGLIGLLWSANPDLRGFVAETEQIILDTAVPLGGQNGSDCGGNYTTGPNHDWGYGTIDALAATQQILQFGRPGTLAGTVTDLISSNPITNATIEVGIPAWSEQTTSDAQGNYSMEVFGQTYTVTTSAYGYQPKVISQVTVNPGLTTTLPITLTPSATYVVSGTVTGAVSGAPITATISIDGYQGGAIRTDPATGYYSVTLFADIPYVFTVSAEDYILQNRSVGPLTGDETQSFSLGFSFSHGCSAGYNEVPIFYDGFESGSLGGSWSTSMVYPGRVWVDSTYPYSGTDGVLLDSSLSGLNGTAALILSQDLSGQGSLFLDFWWREFNDQNHALDGVFISDDNGATWHQALSFNNGPNTYRHDIIGISALAAELDLTLDDQFQIKFQFYGSGSIPNDGYALDEVKLATCAYFAHGYVSGTVSDANTGLPLEGAEVSSDSRYQTTTDAGGAYSLLDSTGPHTVTAVMNGGYQAVSQVVTITENSAITQNFNLPAARLAHTPATLDVTLMQGTSDTVPLTLTNHGGISAQFGLLEKGDNLVILDAPKAAPLLHAQGQVYEVEQEKAVSQTAGKDVEPAVTTAILKQGSDAFGYTYKDSFNDDGPAYQWLEIAPPAGGSGAELVGLTGVDDGRFWPLTLPFTFTFYGVEYTEIAISSNGGIYFNNKNFPVGNSPIPSDNYYDNHTFIAPLWSDLVIRPGAVYYLDLGSMLIIEYYQVVRFPSYGSGTWQVILFDDNNILFQYKEIDLGDYYTVGIQESATTGLQYSYNTTVPNESAVCFTYPGELFCPTENYVPWLAGTPQAGTLTASATQVISVTFDTTVPEITEPGQYTARLSVGDDSPYVLPAIPVVMTVQNNPNWGNVTGAVTGWGHCDASSALLEDAKILLESGSGQSWNLTTDVGGAYSLWLDQSHSPLTATVGYDGYLSQTVANISVTSGGATAQNFNLSLDAPCLDVTPTDFNITLTQGISATLPLTLTNTGAGAAGFKLNEHVQPDNAPLGSGVDYTFADSNDFNGPTYHWIEIAPPAGGSGTEITAISGSDDDCHTLSLPFAFPFYGASYTELDVSTNGLLYFSNDCDEDDYDNDALPTDWYETFLAPFWYDLYITPGAIYYQDLGSMFVIEFYRVSECCSSTGSDTWQVILFANGDILYQYKNYYGVPTIGIQGDKTTALEYHDHPIILTEGLAVCFSTDICPYIDAAWISTETFTGTVAAAYEVVANTQSVDVTFDAGVVTQTGEYTATLFVTSNDPANPIINIPITMTLVSYGLTVQPSADTQSGTSGSAVTYTLSLTNTGDFTDTFAVALAGHTWPTTAPTIVGPLVAKTGVDLQITVTIPATATGSSQDTATLTVTSQADPTKSATATLTTTLNINDTTPPTFTVSPLITPTNGVVLANTRPTFDWEDAADDLSSVVSYTLLITGSNDGLNVQESSDTVTTTLSNFTPSVDLANGAYTWTVRAHDKAGNISSYVTPPATFALSADSSGTEVYLPIVIKNQ